MDLTGKWEGKYTYGKGYPLHLQGKSDVFELEIEDHDGIFTGRCFDPVVKSKAGNESTVEGTFHENYISFIKRYKYYSFIDVPGEEASPYDVKIDGIHYTGRLLKAFFSGKKYFRGEWVITSEYKNRITNEVIVDSVEGTWTMKKV
jgi:hypothetical protein